MQCDGVDIRISRLLGVELGGPTQFLQRVVGSFEPHERQAERMMKACILWRCGERGPQHTLAVGFPPDAPIEIGKVDCRGRVLRAQP